VRGHHWAGDGEVYDGNRLSDADAHELHRVECSDARESSSCWGVGGSSTWWHQVPRQQTRARGAASRGASGHAGRSCQQRDGSRGVGSIRKIRVGANRVKEANVERLRHEFAEIRFKLGGGCNVPLIYY
jgi:hypothetical protein